MTIVDDLRWDPPGLHAGGTEYWGLAWPALEWLEREVEPGMNTLEVGSGASTLVFASCGAEHEAVTPEAEEQEQFLAECERRGIDDSRVSFHIGLSHEVLPSLLPRPLELVLIDGAHGFPYPILDWWFLAPRLAIGGQMLIDDAYMPPVAALVDALRAQPHWEIERAVGYRTVVVRKLAEGLPSFDWEGERIGGRLNFRYLAPAARVAAAARHRTFTTRVGLGLVRLVRRRGGLRWRRTG